MSSPSSAALLLRGEPFRLGCDAAATAQQLGILASYVTQLLEPLRSNGTSVAVLLAPSHHPALPKCRTELWPRLSEPFGGNVTLRAIAAHNQGEALQHAFRAFAAELSQAAVSVLARFDVPLLRPSTRWTCSLAGDRLAFSSQCAACCGEWESFRCVGDLIHIVPRRLLDAFVGILGGASNRTGDVSGHLGCFQPSSKYRSGHDCFNVWARFHPDEPVQFCAPPPPCETEDSMYFRIVRGTGPLAFDRDRPGEVVASRRAQSKSACPGRV